MKRLIDLFLALTALILFFVPALILAVIIYFRLAHLSSSVRHDQACRASHLRYLSSKV